MQVFGGADQARVQSIPMAYVNYRIGHHSFQYGKGKEDEGIGLLTLAEVSALTRIRNEPAGICYRICDRF
jgi:hypothetical protein